MDREYPKSVDLASCLRPVLRDSLLAVVKSPDVGHHMHARTEYRSFRPSVHFLFDGAVLISDIVSACVTQRDESFSV